LTGTLSAFPTTYEKESKTSAMFLSARKKHLQGIVKPKDSGYLFTVTGYSGMDPEVSGDTDYMSYPTPISVTFGVNVSF
jgi:hypothetical protein